MHHSTNWTENKEIMNKLMTVTCDCVEDNSILGWDFPQICCSAGCRVAVGPEVDLISGITDLSHYFCLW